MLYKKNEMAQLSAGLFNKPTCEYRGTPFWAWNCKLEKEQLMRQIEYFKEMGFGGFHIHSRTGMATPYLGSEFMALVKACTEKARLENMLVWLYDEDRWPSGFAGGFVTADPANRLKYLLFTPFPYTGKAVTEADLIEKASARRMENGKLLARFNITLGDDGSLMDYRILSDGDTGKNVWYAYVETAVTNPWYNNQAYVNTLDKKAIDKFIEITYEAYKKAVGEDFGGIVPAIFTDEPQFTRKTRLNFASDRMDVFLPWTDDLPDTYKMAYNEDLVEHLPELIWDLPNGAVSTVRYHYHDHVAQRFAEAFAYNCGEWCRKNGLMLTGHLMEEPTLESQTAALGEAMRSYKGFDLPGIDMLCDRREYTTAKQAQSAAHQFGCGGVLSELYGVTNWDFDFRGHKLQGDWQAALGVTVRVPHLSWVSMEGEAKRDYPASISYQSPWYKEYKIIEDHFARVNTAMTRGKPNVRVGVIHPVESYWLFWGPQNQTSDIRRQLSENFENITQWLLFGQIDFDFISESLLPDLCPAGGAPLKVGAMSYDVVIVPDCKTLRSSTIERLENFVKENGRLLFVGSTPEYVDAMPENGRLDLLKSLAKTIKFERYSILSSLEDVRTIDIRAYSGERKDNLLYQLRQDGEAQWLFIANGKKPQNMDVVSPEQISIRIRGLWRVELYDTMTGDIRPLDSVTECGFTIIEGIIYAHDSLLFKLTPGETSKGAKLKTEAISVVPEGLIRSVPVRLSEPNVLLLDMAEYAFDNGQYQPEEEILRIDNLFREMVGYPPRQAAVAQPWTVTETRAEHTLSLRFRIESEIGIDGTHLALENAEHTKIVLNGQTVPSVAGGWYTDESIKTVHLPKINSGTNILELHMPFGRRTNTEWCYILGDFGVRVDGFNKTLTRPVTELAFGDIVPQGLPFYGGNIHYLFTVEGHGRDVRIHVPAYRGALIGVTLDGKRIGSIVFAPYNFTIPKLAEGKHEIGLILFGSRVNSFGPVHNCDSSWDWFGPMAWRTTGDQWSYEYSLKKIGILKSPAIIEL